MLAVGTRETLWSHRNGFTPRSLSPLLFKVDPLLRVEKRERVDELLMNALEGMGLSSPALGEDMGEKGEVGEGDWELDRSHEG